MDGEKNRRILVIDNSHAIHADFRKILARRNDTSALDEDERLLFGEAPSKTHESYDVDSAYQGEEGFQKVQAALKANQRYALAFIDMRMPPGWDGLRTIQKIWEVDSEIQVVMCTAYSEYSWDDIIRTLGTTDRLLILKKPFDTAEVCQLACALTEKWHLAKHAYLKLNQLSSMVESKRSICTSPTTSFSPRSRSDAARSSS